MLHKYRNNGYNIVLDTDSGAVHVMDNAAYDIVDICGEFFRENPQDIPGEDEDPSSIMVPPLLSDAIMQADLPYSDREIEEALYEIVMLASRRQLFTEDIYKGYVNELNERNTIVKALCLHVAHDCNLSCKYCFAKEGEYNKERGLMSLEVAKKSLDFLVANSGNRVNLEVDFFGGEPLLNFEVVKGAVEYGRSLEKDHKKKFRFTITTNGVLLNDEIMDFINSEMDNVVLSIDGRPEVHDNMRPFRGGSGSFDKILPLCKKMADSRKGRSWYVRGTYTHYNTDFSKDVLYLADEGFDQISVEPVVAPEDMDYAIKEEDIPVLLNEYDRLAEGLLARRSQGRDINFFHFNIDLEGGPCVAKRLSGCGSGTEYLAVTPWGDLYPCHQFVGNDEFLMGNVTEGVKREDLMSSFKSCSVYSKEECDSCFAKYYCSGGCAANSYYYGGGINGSYKMGCQLQKKRIECAIMMKIAQFDNV